jgi:hypothetical protein
MMVGQVESLRPFALLRLGLSRGTLPKMVIVGKVDVHSPFDSVRLAFAPHYDDVQITRLR